VGLELDLAALPLAPGVRAVAAALGRDPAELAATGGEDYELCVCLPEPAYHAASVPLQAIGAVVAGAGVAFAGTGARLRGFEHHR
jgi:thiamine-monophosphate kinase